MAHAVHHLSARHPARWAVVLAFTLVYLSWGTTFLAIQIGVEAFPPALFSGVRVMLAGLILLAYVRFRGHKLSMPRREFLWITLVGILLFVGGNGLLTVAEKFVSSGVSSVLAATTPLWMALLEMLWPRGERLRPLGWLGLLAGLAGVVLLLCPRLQESGTDFADVGPLLILGSAISWSVAAFVIRWRPPQVAHLASAAYQMALGGGTLALIGLIIGEPRQLAWERCTPQAVYSFFHLLVFGSLVGFVAYNWLLANVSPAMAGTYAYVNPMIAIAVGWLLNGEEITWWILAGMATILVGVALVKAGHRPKGSTAVARDNLAPYPRRSHSCWRRRLRPRGLRGTRSPLAAARFPPPRPAVLDCSAPAPRRGSPGPL
jgi:drug/metabolite transporter (DMT)-like permease